ncbi:hypothetical protein COOONC_18724 [Cooperia oncophora]
MMHDTSKIHPIILGDFNAHLGKKTNDMESSLGRHTYDSCRNTRGQILVDFCEELQLRAAATFFKTRNGRKWTWRSPNGKTFSCIDHIFACRHLRFNSIRTGSIQFETDHRLLRGILEIHSCTTRMRKRTRSKSYLDRDAYQMELARICPRTIQDPSNRYQEICRYIRNAASVAIRRTQARHYLSTDTLSLMRQRQQLKREMNTLTDRVAYIETCKLLRRMIRNDIRLHHRDLVQKAIATGGSLKIVQNQMSVGRRQPTQLRDKKGKLCVSRNEIKEVIREYYDQLYTSQSMVPYTQWKKDDDDCAPILPSEVETALKNTNARKTPGHDLITTEMLQWGAVNLIPLITELFNECLRTDDLDKNSRCCGLKINSAKIKIMARTTATIFYRDVQLDQVQTFTYLGQEISLYHDFSGEITRRIHIGVRLLDHKTNAWLRGVTKVKDVVEKALERKWSYAWEMARSSRNKWSKLLTEWHPYLRRRIGRPKSRWRDEFKKVLITCNWQNAARCMTKKEWIDLMRCHIL